MYVCMYASKQACMHAHMAVRTYVCVVQDAEPAAAAREDEPSFCRQKKETRVKKGLVPRSMNRGNFSDRRNSEKRPSVARERKGKSDPTGSSQGGDVPPSKVGTPPDIDVYIDVYVCVYVYTYMHSCIHTYTHTHTFV